MVDMKFYSLYSGGKDSTVCASVLQEAGMLQSCVAFDTGISTPDWMGFVKQSCADHKWPLIILKTPESYEDLVRKYGFPGPGMHPSFMNYLKGRCVREFNKIYRGQCLASGVRKLESSRRGRSTKQWSVMEGVPVFAPIFNWSTEETWRYFNDRGFQRSPAYATLCISGDCLCGAFAQKGEREIIRDFYPDVFKRIEALEIEKEELWGNRSCRNTKRKKNSSVLCVDCDMKEKTL